MVIFNRIVDLWYSIRWNIEIVYRWKYGQEEYWLLFEGAEIACHPTFEHAVAHRKEFARILKKQKASLK